jgi:hypothetical protein
MDNWLYMDGGIPIHGSGKLLATTRGFPLLRPGGDRDRICIKMLTAMWRDMRILAA